MLPMLAEKETRLGWCRPEGRVEEGRKKGRKEGKKKEGRNEGGRWKKPRRVKNEVHEGEVGQGDYN